METKLPADKRATLENLLFKYVLAYYWVAGPR